MINQYYLEIKNRFFLLILTWFSTIFVSYAYKEILLFLCLTKVNLNYNNFYFIVTDVKEVFSVYIQLIFFIGNQIFVFYLFFHIFAFISMGLYNFEYKYLKIWFNGVTFFWILAFILFNQILLPISWDFFLNFQTVTTFSLYLEAKLNEYLNFFIYLYYFCIFYCQFFVILMFYIIYYTNTSLELIKKSRKFLYYCFVFFSTLITPPDVISQIFFSILTIIIYELLVIFCILKFFS